MEASKLAQHVLLTPSWPLAQPLQCHACLTAECADICCWLLQLAADGLKGRVFEVSLADLQNNEGDAHRKMKLRVEDVQGKNCLTNFWVSGICSSRLLAYVSNQCC